jgi:hypothetical protein
VPLQQCLQAAEVSGVADAGMIIHGVHSCVNLKGCAEPAGDTARVEPAGTDNGTSPFKSLESAELSSSNCVICQSSSSAGAGGPTAATC